MLLRANPSMAWHPFDSAYREERLLCEVREAAGSIKRYALPVTIQSLIQRFDGHTLTVDAVRDYCEEQGNAVDVVRITRLVERVLVSRQLLVSVGARGVVIESSGKDGGRYLDLRAQLLPPGFVAVASRVLTFLFNRYLALILGSVLLVAHLAVYGYLLTVAHTPARDVIAQGGGWIALLVVVAALIHEFGHATAAYRFGCRQVAIGIGQYLHLTVLYTDLSEAWRLPRIHRVVIDLGGVYFQSLFALGLLIAAPRVGWGVPLAFFVLNDIAVVTTMNPFLRLDGYWVTSDATGIANLRAESYRLLEESWRNVRSGRWKFATARVHLGRRAALLLSVYSVLFCVFAVYIGHALLTDVGPALLRTYPSALVRLRGAVEQRPIACWPILAAALSVLWRTLVAYALLRFVYRSIARPIGQLASTARGWIVRHSRRRTVLGRRHFRKTRSDTCVDRAAFALERPLQARLVRPLMQATDIGTDHLEA